MGRLELGEGNKFSLLLIENVYSALPSDGEDQLSDGTWVLTRVPLAIEAHWKEWIGSVRFEKLKEANIVLLRSEAGKDPQILDEQHERLGKHLAQIFYLLQLSGVLEHEGASLLKGSVVHSKPQIRGLSDLTHFKRTKGYTRTPVDLDRYEQAARFTGVLREMDSNAYEFKRVIRGLNVSMDGLQQEHGQERIHQFVRSLEALILPEAGETRRQFVHRCQTFAEASAATRGVLKEAFDMRSDTEHLHDWDRSLQSYPEEIREDVALQRTRQMERLSSFAYSRILENEGVRNNFRNEATQRNFWRGLHDASRKKVWGEQLDLTTIKLVRTYDQWGRAQQTGP